MGTAPRHACQWAGCPVLLEGAARYCEKHLSRVDLLAAEREKFRRAQPEARASKRFLNSAEWQRARLDHLKAQPFCADCERKGLATLATEVHHVQPRAARPDLALERSNLESLCHDCHSAKTAAEGPRRRRG